MERLWEASCRGSVEELHRLIGEAENRHILENLAVNYAHENPLHVAIKGGHLGFVQEMLKLKPEFAREQNQDGFRPLDLASALGHVEIVKELIKSTSGSGNDICRLKGRDGRTAIHYSVLNGKIEVMDELLSSSPVCVKDVTLLGETTLHLAVKYFQFEAFRKLLEWVENHDGMLEEVVNCADHNDGYTILHLAVNKRQCEVVELLVGSSSSINTRAVIKINATNSKGLTAMDIMDIMIKENVSSDDVHLKDILHRAGALTAVDASAIAAPHVALNIVPNNNIVQGAGAGAAIPAQQAAGNRTNQGSTDWLKYFMFKMNKESPSETRNALLVVVVLIITVTYQAGVSPPSHILNSIQGKRGRWHALLFYIPNTVGLFAPTVLLIILTTSFPLRVPLYISMVALWSTYVYSIGEAVDYLLVLYITLTGVFSYVVFLFIT